MKSVEMERTIQRRQHPPVLATTTSMQFDAKELLDIDGQTLHRMMEENVDTRKEMSDVLAEELHIIGVSRSRLLYLRSLMKLSEKISNQFTDQKWVICIGGSSIECTRISTSDVDLFLVLPKLRASYKPVVAHQKREKFVNIKIKSCGIPGFCWLMLIKADNKKEKLQSMPSSFRHCLIDTQNGTYVSSELLVESCMGNRDTDERNGPAVRIQQQPGFVETDLVIGIECDAWPDEAMDWFRRDRHNGWPNATRIDMFRQSRCYVVPTGDSSSEHRSRQWRYAFFDMERELVWSFCDTQVQTLVVLKILNKSYIEPIAADQISTYILKTIIFWESERRGQSYWLDNKLLYCVDMCLGELEECIRKRHLSHYVIKERNLLNTKLSDTTTHQRVIECIQNIRKNLVTSFLRCNMLPFYYAAFPSEEHRRKSLENYCGDWNIFIKEYRQYLSKTPRMLIRMRLLNIDIVKLRLHVNVQFYCRPENFQIVEERTLDILSTIQTKGDECDKYINRSVRSYFYTQMAYLALGLSKRGIKGEWRKKAGDFFLNSCKDSGISHLLHLATYRYACGEKHKSLQLVEYFCSKWDKSLYVGLYVDQFKEVNRDDCEQVQTQDVIFDLIFPNSARYCDVPPALQFDLSSFGYEVDYFPPLHPFFYGLYLLFQIHYDHHNLEKCEEILSQLSQCHSKIIYHHNILGFCLYKMGDVSSAAQLFIQSISRNPYKTNAAYYHLCIAILKHAQLPML